MTNASGTMRLACTSRTVSLPVRTGPAGTFTYSYNALSQLDSYTINGTRTNLLLDAAGEVIAAYDAAGTLIANYQYGLGLIPDRLPGDRIRFMISISLEIRRPLPIPPA